MRKLLLTARLHSVAGEIWDQATPGTNCDMATTIPKEDCNCYIKNAARHFISNLPFDTAGFDADQIIERARPIGVRLDRPRKGSRRSHRSNRRRRDRHRGYDVHRPWRRPRSSSARRGWQRGLGHLESKFPSMLCGLIECKCSSEQSWRALHVSG